MKMRLNGELEKHTAAQIGGPKKSDEGAEYLHPPAPARGASATPEDLEGRSSSR